MSNWSQCDLGMDVMRPFDKLAGPWLEGYINVYIYIYILLVIRGPERVKRSTELILYVRGERRNELPQLDVHLCCV